MGTYKIQNGDTLAKIAQDWGTTVEDIATQNHITDVNMIMAGTELTIGNDNGSAAPVPVTSSNVVEEVDLSEDINSEETTYTVQGGDTLSKIADQYGVSVEDIARWNNIANVNTIYTGDVLVIKPSVDKMNQVEEVQYNQEQKVDSGPTTLSAPEVAPVNTSGELHGEYSGVLRHKRSASANCIAAQGIITYDNKQYTVGTETSGNTISNTDYLYLVGQVCGESGIDCDDMLGVTCTILNRMEAGEAGGSVKGILSQSYWPWGKTCDKFINYDNYGNPVSLKTIEQIGSAEYEKLQRVIGVVSDAMSGVRNINSQTFYYAGDGTHNYFSDSYL